MKVCYGLVTQKDLMEEAPREIFKTILKLYTEGTRWNRTVVKSELKDQESFVQYFKEIRENKIDDIEVFKNIVKNLKISSIRRKMHSFLFRRYNEVWEADPAITTAESLSFFKDLDIRLTKEDEKDLSSPIEQHIDLMKMRYKGEMTGITTGFPDLDDMLGQRLKRREVIVPAARPSVGKTSFALSLAYNAAKEGYNVLFVAIEMDEVGIMDRMMAFETGLPLTSIVRGEADKEIMKDAYRRLKKLPFTLKFLPSPSSAEIQSLASKHKHKTGLDLLVIDYLGLVDKNADGDEVRRLGRIMVNLKATANILDCAIVIPHQLNRKGASSGQNAKDPLLENLRGSGEIEEHAAIVMFLTRDTIGVSGEKVKLRISKNRYGETGQLDLRFNTLTTRFESLA